MKKFDLTSYALRTKWIVVLLGVIFLLIFGRTVNSPALTKTAIVIGIGVDFDAQNEEFVVTTQSVHMISSSNESSGQNTYQTYTSSGKTISSALDDISQKMGLIVSLAHCEVLFMSQEALKQDHLQTIYPLNNMYALREQAVIVTGDRSPKDLISLKVGTSTSAPYFLQTAIVNNEGTDGLIKTTAKDLLARSLSRSEATAIPYIMAVEMTDQPIDSQGEQKGNYEFDLSRVLVFNRSKSMTLDEDLSEILSIYLSETTSGSLNFTDKDGSSFEFRILKKDVRTSAKGRAVKAEIELSVDLLDVQHIADDKIVSGADEIVKQAARDLADELTARMRKLHEISLSSNIDFLGLQAKAYQSVGRKLEKDCLPTISFSPSVKISVKEAA